MKKLSLLPCVFLLLTACARAPDDPVTLRILSFNDFHGNIQAANPSPGRLPLLVDGKLETVDAGGAAYLATLIAQQKQGHDNSVVISAGDLTGASPLISSLLKDEPTINVMNHIGLDINVVGNHEFDFGMRELRRKMDGDGRFAGAEFEYLAANVIHPTALIPPFHAVAIREYQGIRVAFIGLVTAETPTIVAAKGIQGLVFHDPLQILNNQAKALRRQGIQAIVAILHEGATAPSDIAQDGSPCMGMEGALARIVAAADPAIDLFITGHTHQAYACRLDGRLVTQTASYGRMLSVIDLELAHSNGDVAGIAVRNLPVTHNLTPDPAVEAIVAAAESATGPIRAQPVAELPGPLLRTPDANGESALGDVIADAHLAATRLLETRIAFTNPGGIRQDLPSNAAAEVKVTLGDLFAVQPFGNNLVAMDLTGAQIKQLLEQQWLDQPADRKPRMLQVSRGFTYCFDDNRAEGDKILAERMLLDGQPLAAESRYRIVVNSFLADGGDRFSVFKAGTAREQGDNDLNALREYLVAYGSSVPRLSLGRICRQ